MTTSKLSMQQRTAWIMMSNKRLAPMLTRVRTVRGGRGRGGQRGRQALPREELVARLVAIGAGHMAEANEPRKWKTSRTWRRVKIATLRSLPNPSGSCHSRGPGRVPERPHRLYCGGRGGGGATKAEGCLQSQLPVGPSNCKRKSAMEQFGHFARAPDGALAASCQLRKMMDRTQSKTHKTVRYVEEVPIPQGHTVKRQALDNALSNVDGTARRFAGARVNHQPRARLQS